MSADTFRAFLATKTDDGFERGVQELQTTDLPGDGVLINVEWSSVNYKDALASTPDGRVARISPLIPGIDLAGTVAEDADDFSAGTRVLAHGYDLGVARFGGFAGQARVPAEWIVELPTGLDAREAMIIGTAGYTAALSVIALLDHGIEPASGQILVTGATGGVGSTAVNLLAGLGFEVVASTGKADSHEYLRELGAIDVIDRATLGDAVGKPLDKTEWAGAVDCVGGTTLANVLSKIHYGGAVAASGVTGGAQVPTTVMPFILRGVSLLGIDSVQTPIEVRRDVWQRLAGEMKPDGLDEIGHTIELEDLDTVLTRILDGGATGRYVVRTGG
ncbi:MAG TPA: oxidoreductase [Acidimicrobiales bacterium]|jgi:putative YhdH/YhfP family quinone oxidoreductase|nr:oxidoreductase [Acidimicrobiales bacterium]